MEPKEVIDNNSKVTRNVIITIGSVLFGILALIAVYQILKHYMHVDLVKFAYDLFMLKYLPTLGNDSSYGLLFILGVLTSVHCIGMCGGIAMSQTINKGENLKGKKRDIKGLMLPSALYNFGRVISYTFIGGLVGGLGQILSFNGVMKGIVPIVGGVLMIIMGIKLLGIFPQLRRFNIPVPSFVAKKLVSQNSYTPFIVGILTGLMPCGPLQIVQLYALGTRSVFIGALSMFVFSLGTLPALFIFGILNSFISKKNSNKILKLSAAFVVILGFVMIGRGLALSGISLNFGSHNNVASEGIAKIEGGIQKVTTKIDSGSYPPIVVQKGIPVQWTITADEDNLNHCNNAITIPKLNINKKLTVGENIVEFAAESEGEIIYTCWMGMIKSSIYVVSDIDKPENVDLLSANNGIRETSNCNMGSSTGENTSNLCEMNNDEESLCNGKMHKNGEDCGLMEKKQSTTDDKEIIKILEENGAIYNDDLPNTVEHSEESKLDVVESENGKEIADPIKVETWEGYLIDRHCFGMVRPEIETRACLLMDECMESGYGIAVKKDDESYEFFIFDEKGKNLAYEQLSKLEKNSEIKITVKGQFTENMIKVSELSVY